MVCARDSGTATSALVIHSPTGVGGNDSLSGSSGDDILIGGLGNDMLLGQGNNDRRGG